MGHSKLREGWVINALCDGGAAQDWGVICPPGLRSHVP